jgi:hypothetical protein
MAVRFSALRPGRSLTSGRFPVLNCVKGLVDPSAIVRLKGLEIKWEIQWPRRESNYATECHHPEKYIFIYYFCNYRNFSIQSFENVRINKLYTWTMRSLRLISFRDPCYSHYIWVQVSALPEHIYHESGISIGSTLYIANDAFKDLDLFLLKLPFLKRGVCMRVTGKPLNTV